MSARHAPATSEIVHTFDTRGRVRSTMAMVDERTPAEIAAETERNRARYDRSTEQRARTAYTCGTTHCRAGWVVALAGKEGRALEGEIGTPAAASLIYLASDPTIGRFPDFYCAESVALADMKAMAEAEAARAVQA